MERNKNPNREIWESPNVYVGEDVNYRNTPHNTTECQSPYPPANFIKIYDSAKKQDIFRKKIMVA